MRIRMHRGPGLGLAVLSASAALALLGFATSGCDTTAPAPLQDLEGPWTYSFTAIDTVTCPQAPGLVQGCGGAGTLDLTQKGPFLGGGWTMRGGCQSCGGAGDFFNEGTLDGTVSFSALDFEIDGFRFHADLPSADADTITGTVSSDRFDLNAHGPWTMIRSE